MSATAPVRPATTPNLFLVMTFAVIGVGTLESVLLAVGSWWVLPVLMLTLIAVTVGVALAVGRALADDDGVEAVAPAPEPALAPVRRAPRPARHVALAH